jgi:hypothetical protein
MDTGSFKYDASSIHLPICASTCAKIFILLLIVNDFPFHLLSIFHPLAVKFVLINNIICSLESEVTWAMGD